MKTNNKPTNEYWSDFGYVDYHCNKKRFNLYEGNSLKIVYNPIFLEEEFDEIRLVKKDKTCPVCGCRSVSNGSYGITYNKDKEIRIGGYKCRNKDHEHYFYASAYVDLDKFCTFDREVRIFGIKVSLIEYLSEDKISEFLEALIGIRINRETIYSFTVDNVEEFLKELQQEQEIEIRQLKIKPSGHYNYDEQYIFINDVLFMRMTVIDNKTNLVLGDEFISHEEFDKDTIKEFLEKSLNGHKLYSITTDGNNAYPNIIKALDAIHHRCIFHLMQNLMDDIQPDINNIERRLNTIDEKLEENRARIEELKKLDAGKHGKPSKDDKEWNKRIKERKKLTRENSNLVSERSEKRQSRNAYITYKDRVSLIFKSKSVKTAMNRFNRLLNDKRVPDKIITFLKRIEKNLPNIINSINNEDIPSTNNKVEGYYKITLPRHIKRIFRTEKGAKLRILLSKIRWTHRHVLKHTGPVIKINLLPF